MWTGNCRRRFQIRTRVQRYALSFSSSCSSFSLWDNDDFNQNITSKGLTALMTAYNLSLFDHHFYYCFPFVALRVFVCTVLSDCPCLQRTWARPTLAAWTACSTSSPPRRSKQRASTTPKKVFVDGRGANHNHLEFLVSRFFLTRIFGNVHIIHTHSHTIYIYFVRSS